VALPALGSCVTPFAAIPGPTLPRAPSPPPPVRRQLQTHPTRPQIRSHPVRPTPVRRRAVCPPRPPPPPRRSGALPAVRCRRPVRHPPIRHQSRSQRRPPSAPLWPTPEPPSPPRPQSPKPPRAPCPQSAVASCAPPGRRHGPDDPSPSPQSAAAAPCAPLLSAIGAAAIDILPLRRCGPRRSRRPCPRSTGAPSPAPIRSSAPATRVVRSTWYGPPPSNLCVPCAMPSLSVSMESTAAVIALVLCVSPSPPSPARNVARPDTAPLPR
jgi:hypothetical protein